MNPGLCVDRAGRQLIYTLSQKHRNSLVLNYAIQRILQAGHEEEVANVGSSLASYFSVFHRLLTNRLKQVPQADAAALQSLTAELKVTHLTQSILGHMSTGSVDLSLSPSGVLSWQSHLLMI